MRRRIRPIPYILIFLLAAMIAAHAGAQRIPGTEPEGYKVSKSKAPVTIRIMDSQAPVKLFSIPDVVLFTAEAVLLVFLIGWIVSFIRKKIEALSQPTPFESAQRELQALKKAMGRKSISAAELCAGISFTIRSYVQREFAITSSELTTSDFLGELRPADIFSDQIRMKARDVLSLCDVVKFSGYEPSMAQLNDCIKNSEDIIISLNDRSSNKMVRTGS